MILLDHCVPNKFLKIIHGWGYQADFLQTHIKPDADDPEVIKLAQELDAVLLTVDMDFSNILNYPPKDFQGIIVIRYQAIKEQESLNTLKQVLQDLYRDKLRGVLIVITVDRYRVRSA